MQNQEDETHDMLLMNPPNMIRKISRQSVHSKMSLDHSVAQLEDSKVMELNTAEDRQVGTIGFKVFHEFIQELGGYMLITGTFILIFTGASLAMYSSKFLEDWSNKFEGYEGRNKYENLKIYAIIAFSGAFFDFLRNLIMGIVGYKLAVRMHSSMLYSILHARLQEFLDVVPYGRILNRFSKDIDVVDKRIYDYLPFFFYAVSNSLVIFITVCYTVGWEVIILMVIWFILVLILQNTFLNVRREYKRLASIAKSPLVNSCGDTIRGLTVIRSLGIASFMREKYDKAVENILKNGLMDAILINWFDLRVGLSQELLIQITSIAMSIYYYETITSANMGLLLYCTFTMGSNLRRAVKQRAEFEMCMVSVERCSFFYKLESEVGHKTLDMERKMFAKGGSARMKRIMKFEQNYKREEVVRDGELRFQNVTAKYASNSKKVLKNITFTVKPGEKVGVVGRTGSGKSTLIKLIWRYMDPVEGAIIVDGKDICDVDLKALRDQMMIITQETSLFEGTLRENLDPTGFRNTDAEITAALRKLDFQHQSFEKEGLDMEIDAGGSNLSKGEKQLVCFARAILKKANIIVLDEATASIDIKTEEKIQKCVDEEFKDCSMVIIAHRVQTVMECDKILVLELGRVDDFDTPQNLMRKGGFFAEIVEKMQSQ